MISFLKIYLFSLAGLAMGILNLAIVIPQVITFLNVFSRLWFRVMHISSPVQL